MHTLLAKRRKNRTAIPNLPQPYPSAFAVDSPPWVAGFSQLTTFSDCSRRKLSVDTLIQAKRRDLKLPCLACTSPSALLRFLKLLDLFRARIPASLVVSQVHTLPEVRHLEVVEVELRVGRWILCGTQAVHGIITSIALNAVF